jgi:hypothetical protein
VEEGARADWIWGLGCLEIKRPSESCCRHVIWRDEVGRSEKTGVDGNGQGISEESNPAAL